MKAFNEAAERQFSELVSSFSLTEKLAAHVGDPDEHSQIGILTSGLTSLPPSQSFDQWRWEFVSRYSGATVPDSHGVPGHLAVTSDHTTRLFQRAITVLRLQVENAKNNFQKVYVSQAEAVEVRGGHKLARQGQGWMIGCRSGNQESEVRSQVFRFSDPDTFSSPPHF